MEYILPVSCEHPYFKEFPTKSYCPDCGAHNKISKNTRLQLVLDKLNNIKNKKELCKKINNIVMDVENIFIIKEKSNEFKIYTYITIKEINSRFTSRHKWRSAFYYYPEYKNINFLYKKWKYCWDYDLNFQTTESNLGKINI